MKKILYAMILLLVITVGAYAVPQYINYQGILRDIPGNLQNGTFAMTFKIYNADAGSSAIFDSGSTQVTVSNGLYNVRLGPVNSANIFDDNDNKWLEVTVGSDTLSPRLRINSVAYALRADVAGTAASATNATSANYATLSGTASNAATVSNIGASTTPVADKLYPLDSSGKLSGVPISATASGTGNALYINGSIGAIAGSGSNPGAKPCGYAIIPGVGSIIPPPASSVTVNNSLVTSSSIILVTPQFSDTGVSYNTKWLTVSNVASGNFTVRTCDNGVPSNDLKFFYLIIN